jgi:hypothetical protein
VERDKPKKIAIGRTNFAAVAMEIKKKGDLNFFLISFIKLHETSQEYSYSP